MAQIASIFFLTTLVFLGCGSKNQRSEDTQLSTAQTANDYPDLTLTLAKGGALRTKNLTGKNVFVFFQPDCRHCQIEAINIEQRLEAFGDYHLYFISSGDMEAIKAFGESFDLYDKENVTFAWAATEGVLDHYGPISTPSVYIYADGRLKRYFNGQTEIDSILEAL